MCVSGEKRHKHTSMCVYGHTHGVQGASECRAVGVRLQERGHPKRRLLLSLFNRWLGRLFEGPFNCRGDGALKTRRLFSPLLLISPLMTPIKTPTLLFLPFFLSPLPVALSLPLLLVFLLTPYFLLTLGGFVIQVCPSMLNRCLKTAIQRSLEAKTNLIQSHPVDFYSYITFH